MAPEIVNYQLEWMDSDSVVVVFLSTATLSH